MLKGRPMRAEVFPNLLDGFGQQMFGLLDECPSTLHTRFLLHRDRGTGRGHLTASFSYLAADSPTNRHET